GWRARTRAHIARRARSSELTRGSASRPSGRRRGRGSRGSAPLLSSAGRAPPPPAPTAPPPPPAPPRTNRRAPGGIPIGARSPRPAAFPNRKSRPAFTSYPSGFAGKVLRLTLPPTPDFPYYKSTGPKMQHERGPGEGSAMDVSFLIRGLLIGFSIAAPVG